MGVDAVGVDLFLLTGQPENRALKPKIGMSQHFV